MFSRIVWKLAGCVGALGSCQFGRWVRSLVSCQLEGWVGPLKSCYLGGCGCSRVVSL